MDRVAAPRLADLRAIDSAGKIGEAATGRNHLSGQFDEPAAPRIRDDRAWACRYAGASGNAPAADSIPRPLARQEGNAGRGTSLASRSDFLNISRSGGSRAGCILGNIVAQSIDS
jgi:hypothetical protein